MPVPKVSVLDRVDCKMMRRMCLTFFKLNPLQDVNYTKRRFVKKFSILFLPITDARGWMDMQGTWLLGLK